MYLFAAGGGSILKKDSGTWCAEQKVHKLYSIYNEVEQLLNYNHPYKLIADSGGHVFNKGEGGINELGHKRTAAAPDPHKYMKYYMDSVYKLRNKECIIFELDIYGHLPTDTIDGMYRDLNSIKDKKFKLVRCFHPLGIDKDFSLRTLKKWIDKEGQDYIAISDSSDTRFHDIFKITRNEVKIHGLAQTGFSVLSKFPFYSADSTNALVTPFSTGAVVIDRFGKRISLKKARADRSLNYLLYHDTKDRLEHSIKVFKKAEEYYTKLWEKRGIVWQ